MESSRTPLAGRYRYLNGYKTADGTVRWSATDAESGKPVLAAVLPSTKLAHLDAIRGEKHLHLAAILDVVREPEAGALPDGIRFPAGAAVAVAELVPGQTLRGQLKRGRIHPYKAVAWVLRLADALSAIHRRGGVHGSLSPRSIVVEPVGRAIAPVLAQLVAPPLAVFCSPSRLQGAGPTPEDDVWALHAVMYASLTGVAPFAGTGDHLLHGILSGAQRPLAEFGIIEPVLQRILDWGLSANETVRVTDLAVLTQSLDAWERGKEPDAPPVHPTQDELPGPRVAELFFEETMLPDEDAVEAPRAGDASPGAVPAVEGIAQLQKSGAAQIPRPLSPATGRSAVDASGRRRKPRLAAYVWMGIAGLLLTTGVGGLVWSMRAERSSAVRAPELELGESPGPAVSSSPAPAVELTPAQQMDLCVRSYFEEEMLPAKTALDFVCSDEDFRDLSFRLFQAVSASRTAGDAGTSAGPGIVVRASANSYDLGWFELASAAIVRATCCPKADPVTLPETSGWCQQIQGEIRAIAEASKKPIELSPHARRFEDAVLCLYATGTRRPYRYELAPTPTHSHAFQRFLKGVAEGETQRSQMEWLK